MDVLGDGDKAIETLELWKQTYPRDFVPRTNLAARYIAIGRHEQALEEAPEGVRLNPDAGVAYAALAQSSISLNQYQDARGVIEQAFSRKLVPPYGRYMLYALALLDGDAAAMRQQVESWQARRGEAMLTLSPWPRPTKPDPRGPGPDAPGRRPSLERGAKQVAAEFRGQRLVEAATATAAARGDGDARSRSHAEGGLSWVRSPRPVRTIDGAQRLDEMKPAARLLHPTL